MLPHVKMLECVWYKRGNPVDQPQGLWSSKKIKLLSYFLFKKWAQILKTQNLYGYYNLQHLED